MVVLAALTAAPALGAAAGAAGAALESTHGQAAAPAAPAVALVASSGSTALQPVPAASMSSGGSTFRPTAVRPVGIASPTAASSASGGGWTKPATRSNRVVLVGDSLAQEVTPFLQFLTPGKSFVPKFWGGTAPCDWRDVDLQANRRSVVVISFTGNSLTDCMSDGQGGHLVHEAVVAQYRYDIGVLIDKARRVGARVVLVGQPLRDATFDADVEVNGINEVYRQFAAAYPFVSFIDAGRAVELPDGRFTDRLPCTPYDVDCADDGMTVVRGDGVHFCPIEGENPCSVWSSGAFRFALVIASATNNPRVFD